jgi:predicted alpha/beta hydrolase family esterase
MKKVLLLHGWTNKRPEGHWLRLTAAELRARGHQVWYPQFPNPDRPNPTDWQELLRQESNMMDEAPGEAKIAIAHSLGTTNWLQGALIDLFDKPFDQVLLVAPPDPEMKIDLEPATEPLNLSNPLLAPKAQKWAGELTVISSNNDKWLPRGVGIYEEALQVKPIIFENAGHFSLDDGWGPWPGLISWIESGNSQDLLKR